MKSKTIFDYALFWAMVVIATGFAMYFAVLILPQSRI